MERNQPNLQELGEIIQRARRNAGLSVRSCAAAARIDATWLSRFERGLYLQPDPRHLRRLAQVLELDLADLFALAGYYAGEHLPGFAPYLRTRYDLPEEAIQQLRAHFDLIADKYAEREDERGAA
jgi:transcriptional regulator with XRE-family HTH domain